MTFSGHPLHEKQLAYFRHVKAELEARESKTKSISLRRDFLMKQKAKNYQNEHDRISNALHSNLVQDTTKKDIQDRIGKLQKLGASAVNNIKD
jgi:hypothetical protein